MQNRDRDSRQRRKNCIYKLEWHFGSLN